MVSVTALCRIAVYYLGVLHFLVELIAGITDRQLHFRFEEAALIFCASAGSNLYMVTIRSTSCVALGSLRRTLGATRACRVAAIAGTALVVAMNERRDKRFVRHASKHTLRRERLQAAWPRRCDPVRDPCAATARLPYTHRSLRPPWKIPASRRWATPLPRERRSLWGRGRK
jgi:hypothetical protein